MDSRSCLKRLTDIAPVAISIRSQFPQSDQWLSSFLLSLHFLLRKTQKVFSHPRLPSHSGSQIGLHLHPWGPLFHSIFWIEWDLSLTSSILSPSPLLPLSFSFTLRSFLHDGRCFTYHSIFNSGMICSNRARAHFHLAQIVFSNFLSLRPLWIMNHRTFRYCHLPSDALHTSVLGNLSSMPGNIQPPPPPPSGPPDSSPLWMILDMGNDVLCW